MIGLHSVRHSEEVCDMATKLINNAEHRFKGFAKTAFENPMGLMDLCKSEVDVRLVSSQNNELIKDGRKGILGRCNLQDGRGLIQVADTGARRANFTILHEFAHYMILTDDEQRIEDSPILAQLLEIRNGYDGDYLEDVCDEFASDLMLPDRFMADHMSEPLDAPCAVSLFLESRASREAVALKLAGHLVPGDSISIIYKSGKVGARIGADGTFQHAPSKTPWERRAFISLSYRHDDECILRFKGLDDDIYVSAANAFDDEDGTQCRFVVTHGMAKIENPDWSKLMLVTRGERQALNRMEKAADNNSAKPSIDAHDLDAGMLETIERNRKDFNRWLETTISEHTCRPFSKGAISKMRGNLNNMGSVLSKLGCRFGDQLEPCAFAYTVYDEFKAVADGILSDPDFRANSRSMNHGNLSAGIKQYLRFLKERDAAVTVASAEEAPASEKSSADVQNVIPEDPILEFVSQDAFECWSLYCDQENGLYDLDEALNALAVTLENDSRAEAKAFIMALDCFDDVFSADIYEDIPDFPAMAEAFGRLMSAVDDLRYGEVPSIMAGAPFIMHMINAVRTGDPQEAIASNCEYFGPNMDLYQQFVKTHDRLLFKEFI